MRIFFLIVILVTLLLLGCTDIPDPGNCSAKEFTPEPLVIETDKDYLRGNVEIFDADKNMIFEVVGEIDINGDDIRVFTDIDDLRMYVEEDK